MKKEVDVTINLEDHDLMTIEEVVELLSLYDVPEDALDRFLEMERPEVDITCTADIDVDPQEVIDELDPDDLLYHVNSDDIMNHARREAPELFPERLLDQMKMEFFAANMDRIKLEDLENLVK